MKNIKTFLSGEEYLKGCDNYILRSINHEMYLQKLKKSTLSLFDDKRRYISETEIKPWNYSYLLSIVKSKEKFEKVRHVEYKDKSKKFILR